MKYEVRGMRFCGCAVMRLYGCAVVWLWGLCASLSGVHAQTPLLREMVTLAYDRQQGCELGDTIHFEAFVTREGKEGATDYSRVLYVEWLTPAGAVVTRKKLPLVEGKVKSFVVADSLYGSGFYELRAYTRYMTNWKDCQYFSAIVPVYVPQRLLDKPSKPQTRTLSMVLPRLTEDDSYVARKIRFHRDTVYALTQPVESNLMVFGHIQPRVAQPTEEDLRLGDRRLSIYINQEKRVFGGEAQTDSMGRFALYFPDLQGEWNLRIREPKGTKGLHRQQVMVDRLFAPVPRCYMKSELAPERFGMKKWKADKTMDGWTNRFMDCDAASVTMKNAGYVSRGFYAYLGEADHRFERTEGIASPTIPNVARDSVFNKYIDIDLIGADSADPRSVCVDGPSFSGRPIVWIVDGAYRLVTGLKKEITDFEVLRPTKRSMPIYVDEVKSVLISQRPDAFLPYVRCSMLEKKRAVTVFITTHRHFVWDDSGLMNMVWEGFEEE